MLRWSLLVLAIALNTVSFLTVVKSPDWSDWRIALVIGEYGYWLIPIPLITGWIAWRMRGSRVRFAAVTTLLCALTLGLLTRPVLEAWKQSGALPARLAAQFGPVKLDRSPFSFADLFRFLPASLPKEVLTYTEGLQIDFYRAPGKARAPCILLIHGGGWDGGSRSELPHIDRWLAHAGYAVASIDYRLAPAAVWPAQQADALAALAYLKANASKLSIDPTRFVILGRSAGGNIAESVGYAAHDPAIRGIIALYSPADMNFAYQYARDDDALKSPVLLRQFLGGTPATARAAYDSASGYLLVNRSTPPTLLVHGQLDTLVWYRQSERLAARLKENGTPHLLLSMPWATHGLEHNLHGPAGQLTTYSTEWFLAAVTK
jgi:acetyl esterase/lipase